MSSLVYDERRCNGDGCRSFGVWLIGGRWFCDHACARAWVAGELVDEPLTEEELLRLPWATVVGLGSVVGGRDD